MTENSKSWVSSLGWLADSHWATQALVLLPVLAVAGMAAWTMLSEPTNAQSQTVGLAKPQAGQTAMLVTPAAPQQAAPGEPAAVNGLKISSQSWRRGGLGSNALI